MSKFRGALSPSRATASRQKQHATKAAPPTSIALRSSKFMVVLLDDESLSRPVTSDERTMLDVPFPGCADGTGAVLARQRAVNAGAPLPPW
jgi:hypothetical protein